MDYLWSPWRYQYVQGPPQPSDGCIFCDRADGKRDSENLIVARGVFNFIILNRFPYTAGHLMIAPYRHVANLEDAGGETLTEMILLAKKAEHCLGEIYRPHGFNIGMNIGASAGAGVAGHIHLHVVPRWHGDANFMTTVGETRVLPEDLEVTYSKLVAAWTKE